MPHEPPKLPVPEGLLLVQACLIILWKALICPENSGFVTNEMGQQC